MSKTIEDFKCVLSRGRDFIEMFAGSTMFSRSVTGRKIVFWTLTTRRISIILTFDAVTCLVLRCSSEWLLSSLSCTLLSHFTSICASGESMQVTLFKFEYE